MKQYLASLSENMPIWLAEYKVGDKIDFDKLFEGRLLYYPGCGYDGQPVQTCNETHSVHVFIYADYLVSKEELDENLHQHGFKGYHLYSRIELHSNDLVQYGWLPHVGKSEVSYWFDPKPPFGVLDIFERNPEYGENHGSSRFAMIYLCSDGFAAYDALFCNGNGRKAPFILMLQDHCFGCNYNRFGKGGLLERIARRSDTYPEYIMLGESTECWEGYLKVSQNHVIGGMHNFSRHLYKHEL